MTEALVRMRLSRPGARPFASRLTGGVSSDTWRVDLDSGPICVKRALPRLRVAAEWRVPVVRSANEVAWIRCAGAIVPGAVPRILGEDSETRLFAMTYLEPRVHPTWKEQLPHGIVGLATAHAVRERIGR